MRRKYSFLVIALFVLTLMLLTVAFPQAETQIANDTSPAAALSAPAWNFEDHTFDHVDMTKLDLGGVYYQLIMMDNLFQQHGLPKPLHLDYPNGAYNNITMSQVPQLRLTGRTVTGPFMAAMTYPVQNWYYMYAAGLQGNTSFNTIRSIIDDAIAKKGLVIFYTHQVFATSKNNSTYINSTFLGRILDYLVVHQDNGNLEVKTLRQAYNDFNGSRAIVVMTFDDGTLSDYYTVWPMFKSRGFAGTSYICGKYVENATNAPWYNPNAMNWTMIHEMAQTAAGWNVNIISGGGNLSHNGVYNVKTNNFTVTAYDSDYYAFKCWSFDGINSTANPFTLPVQVAGTNHTLTAYFTAQTPPTPSPTPSETPSPTPTPTASPMPTVSPTPTYTSPPQTATPYPTPTPTATPTKTPKPSPTYTPTATPKQTLQPTPKLTPTATPTQTPCETPTSTPSSTSQPTSTPEVKAGTSTTDLAVYTTIAIVVIAAILAAVSLLRKHK